MAGLKSPSPASTPEGIPKPIFVDPPSGKHDLASLPGSPELPQVPSSPTIAKWFNGIPYTGDPVSPMLGDQKARTGKIKDGYHQLQLGTESNEHERVQLVHVRSTAEISYGATEEPGALSDNSKLSFIS